MVDATTMHKQVLVLRLISKFRTLGMFYADLDPLQRHEPQYIPDLDLRTYGFTEADLDTEFDVGSFKAGPGADAPARHHRGAARRRTRARSAPSTCTSPTRATKRFVQERLEPIRARPNYTRRASAGTSSSG